MPSSAEALAILNGPGGNSPAPAPLVSTGGDQKQGDPFADKMAILDQASAGKLQAPKPQPGAMDKLLGNGTERYQLWPERFARGMFESAKDAAALPHDVMEEAKTPVTSISDSDVSTMSVPRVLNAAVQTAATMRQPGGQVIPTERAAAPIVERPPAPPPLNPGQEVAAAGQRLGVDLPRAVTSDSLSTQWIGKVASNIPFSGTPLRQAAKDAIEGLGDAATRTQAEYGVGNIPTSGAAVRSGLDDYIRSTVPDRKEILYNKVGELVDPAKTRPLTETARIAEEIAAKRDTAAITQPSEAVKRVSEALSRPEGLSYEGTKNLRTYIGEMLNGGSPLPADISQSELKRIYGGLSADLRSVAEHAGGDKALRAFERANTYSRLAADRSEKLASILGAKSDEGIFDRITAMAGSNSRANIDLLRSARRSVDAMSWDEYASGVISRLGRDAEGNFSPDRFVTAYGKLTPDAKTILFKSTGKPEAAKALDDIATVSSRMKELNKFANPSGTGQTVAGVAELHGAYVDPLTTLGSIITGRVLSNILARPQSIKQTADWAKAYEQAATAPSKKASDAYTQASRALAVSVAKEVGRSDLAPALFGKLSGAVPGAANPDQKQ